MKIALSVDQLSDAILQYARRKNLVPREIKQFEVELPIADGAYGKRKKLMVNVR